MHNIFEEKCIMNGDKEKNTQLLKYLGKNAKMGADNLETVLSDVKDERLKATLESQVAEYRHIERQAKDKLAILGEQPSDDKFTGICARAMINVKMLMDKSNEHIAEMVVQGSTMGIIDVTKQLKNCESCDDDAVNLAYRLKCIEQKNLDEMKHYL